MAAKESTVTSVLGMLGTVGDKALSLLSGLLAAFLIVYGGYAIYDSLYIEGKAFASTWDMLKYKPEIIDDDNASLASELAAQNGDYRAWLTMYDTGVDYPVMQAQDDLYYASHDVFKKSSLTGALYLAAGNNADFADNYNLIYGHHMDASALFGSLDKYTDSSYFDSHRKGVLVTRTAVFDLNIFAVVKTDAYNGAYYTVGNRDLADVMANIQADQLIYQADAAQAATKIVAMSTCETAETNGRLIVFASMTERDLGDTAPAPENPAVKTPTDPRLTAAATVPTTPGSATPAPAASSATTATTPTPAVPSESTPEPAAPSAPEATPEGPSESTPEESGDPITTPTAGTPATAVVENGAPAAAATPDGAAAPSVPAAANGGASSTPAPAEEAIEDDANPLASTLEPSGASYDNYWALINLICVIASIFILLPIGSLRDKLRRSKQMREANAEGSQYDEKSFTTRMAVGMGIEAVLAIASLVTFVLTEHIADCPMALIDAWTPVMLALLLGSLIVDVLFVRYRGKNGSNGSNGSGPKGATVTTAA